MNFTKILIIMSLFSLFTSCTNVYKIEDDKVYFISWNEAHGTTKHLINADSKTFKSLKNYFGKDKNKVFYKSTTLKNADPATFKILSKRYAIDKNQAYYYGKIIPLKNTSKFKILNNKFYATDGIDFYYNGSPLAVCSVDNFKILHQGLHYSWSTDKCFYYVNGYKVKSKNYTKMHIYKNTAYSKDNEFVYSLDHKFNYKDGIKVFDIDVPSFNVDKEGKTSDKNGYFTFYERSKNK